MDLSVVRFGQQRTNGPRGPLTEAKKKRRNDEHLYRYCGSNEHLLRDYPKKLTRIQAARVSLGASPNAGLIEAAPNSENA